MRNPARSSAICGFTSKPFSTALPDDSYLWIEEADKSHPTRITGADLKTAGGAALAITPPAYAAVMLAALPQSLSGAGACNVTSYGTNFTSTGVDDALTLVDGTVVGQLKQVTHVVDGGSGVLTPDNFADGVDVTFTTGGERWIGLWTGTDWQTTELSNVADGGVVLPAIA